MTMPFPFNESGDLSFSFPANEDPRESLVRLTEFVLANLAALTQAQLISTKAAMAAISALGQIGGTEPGVATEAEIMLKREAQQAIERIGPHVALLSMVAWTGREPFKPTVVS